LVRGSIGDYIPAPTSARASTSNAATARFFDHTGELDQISLAYAITIHKAQGSEFPVVVTPLAMQQYMLLQRNLIYTGITRGKKLVVLIGQRKAMAIAVRNNRTEQRFSGLLARLKTDS
jgi:exodeoxyribonuclease V alpha subunit